jgi:hypothetical protein
MYSASTTRTPVPPDPVRRWRTRDLAERTNTPRETAKRTILPEMQRAGVLVRRGRYWWGRAADIDAWLLGNWPTEGDTLYSTRGGR